MHRDHATDAFDLSSGYLADAFPALDDFQISALAGVGKRRRLADREFLFHTGDTDVSLFVVHSGEVEILEPRNGWERPVGVSGARHFVGDVAVLVGGAAVVSARCRGEVVAIEVASPGLRRAMANLALVSKPIMRAFMARLEGRGAVGFPPAPSSTGPRDLGELSCAELARLRALVRKGSGLPPEAEPDYPYKGHFWRPCVDCRGRCAGPAGESGGDRP